MEHSFETDTRSLNGALRSTEGWRCAIALSVFTPYKVTVQAQAKVRPAGELRIVEAKTEGTVVAINVEENQPIKRGDIIATIDSSRLKTKKSQLQSQIQQSKLQLGQINAQITTLERQITSGKRACSKGNSSSYS